MTPMLNCYPERRTLSDVMLQHPWLHTMAPATYFMYHCHHLGLRSSTRRSKPNAMIWTSRGRKCTNMSRKTRMDRLRIMEALRIRTMSFSGTRRWEIFAILIAVLWIWGTSATEMASFWKNWISDPTGNSKLDFCKSIHLQPSLNTNNPTQHQKPPPNTNNPTQHLQPWVNLLTTPSNSIVRYVNSCVLAQMTHSSICNIIQS